MHDAGNILNSALLSSIDDLREQYLRLSGLDSEERDRAVTQANEELRATQEAISHPSTLRAKSVLLTYQYATRFIYDIEPKSKRHFVELLTRLRHGGDSDVSAWAWGCPPKAEFVGLTQQRLQNVDFYTQVNLLCDELFGVPIPSASDDSLKTWSDRARLTEPGWSWRYASQIKEEQTRWFGSQKRIRSIESQWADHRAKAAQCIDEIAPIFPELHLAKVRLQDLKRTELWLSGHCLAINRAAEALSQGVQLKHLMLEEAHEIGSLFRSATHGL